MSLVRITGLVALAVAATTLQASARSTPVPVPKQDTPTRQQRPSQPQLPIYKADKQQYKHELMLIIIPSTSVCNDPAIHSNLDGKGTGPTTTGIDADNAKALFEPSQIAQAQDGVVTRSRVKVAHSWLVARYPHAPPLAS